MVVPAPLETMHALKALTVGVVGFGRIGREVADRLRAFKCKLLVFDPAVPAARSSGPAACRPVWTSCCEPPTLSRCIARPRRPRGA